MSGSIKNPKMETFVPCAFTNDIEPPKTWERIFEGYKITPRVIQRTLRRCRDNKCDMGYIAKKLGIGDRAIVEYLEREKSIPESIAHRFFQFFTSNETVPKNHAVKKPIVWPTEKQHVEIKRAVRSPDFDTEKLSAALIKARDQMGLTLKDVAKEINAAAYHIDRAEAGKILHQTGKESLIFRLCKFYGLDVKDYETKARVNYKEFQRRINIEKYKRSVPWDHIAAAADISHHLIANYANRSKPRKGIVYLTEEMIRVMEVLKVNPYDVLAKDNNKHAEKYEKPAETTKK